jgi:hypothetical protein
MRRLSLLVCAALLVARGASAQISPDISPTLALDPSVRSPELRAPSVTPSPSTAPALSAAGAQAAQEGRACAGCPRRSVGKAILQTTLVNVLYGLGNLARGEETAKVTPETWWKNMSHGWEWDLNDFVTNQFGHPYQGNNYFTSGRANGLSFWESSALTAFGSATWEFYGETNDASLNDFINTTLGGIALGEMFHRTAWLMRDTEATGKGRLWREIGATILDPVTGYNRFVSGDASRVTEKPPAMVPSTLGSVGSAGVLWHKSTSGSLQDSSADPFAEVDLLYADLKSGRSRTAYDAFGVRLAFGGGRAISEARVRGRLLGQPFRNDTWQLTLSQGYQYNNNDAYRFGAQSLETNLGVVKPLGSRWSVWALGWGGATILGAVDSVPIPTVTPITSNEEPTSRDYDYGPGTNAGGLLHFIRGNRSIVTLTYELHHLHVIDGVRGNHLLQRLRADADWPLRGPLGIGVSGDLFDRRTFYQQADVPDAHSQFPQVRVFLSWSVP